MQQSRNVVNSNRTKYTFDCECYLVKRKSVFKEIHLIYRVKKKCKAKLS